MALKLYCNLDSNLVSTDAAGATGSVNLQLNQGDNGAVWLYFTRNTNTVERTEIVPLPAPYTLIVLAGRPQDSFAAPVLELFDVSSWTAVTDDDGTHYEGVLNLQSGTLNTWLGTKLNLPAFFSITLQDGGTGIWTPIVRGNATIFQDLHGPGGADIGDIPDEYPLPDQIAPITGVNFRFHNPGSGFVLQVFNTTTSLWHTLHIEGAVGSEVLVIETGV